MNAKFHPSSAPVATVRPFLSAALWLSSAAFVFVSPVRAAQTISYTADSSATIDTTGSDATLDVPSSTGAFTQSGLISGTGNVIKSGAGTLTLSAANNYTGTTAINAGTIVMANSSAFGTNTGPSAFTVGGAATRLVVNSGVTSDKILWTSNGATVENHGTLKSALPLYAAAGGLTVINTGTIDSNSSGNAAIDNSVGVTTFTNTSGTIIGGVRLTGGAVVTNDAGGIIDTVYIAHNGPTVQLTNKGGSKIESSSAVTIFGGTLLNTGNSVIRSTDFEGVYLPEGNQSSIVTNDGSLIEGVTYGVTAWNDNPPSPGGIHAVVNNTNGATIKSAATVSAGGIAGVYMTTPFNGTTPAGTVNNGAGSTIIGAQKGVWLSVGGTVTNDGTITALRANSSDAGVLFEKAASTFTNNATGVVNGRVAFGNFANTATLAIGSKINGNLVMGTSTSARINLSGASGTQIYSQAVTGTTTFSGILTKQSAGTWVLDTVFTLTGATTVQAGTLLVNSTFATSAITVQNTATLGGTGTLGGNVTLQSGGRIAPGASIGTLTIGSAKNLTWNAGGTMAFELGAAGSSDRLAVAGALTKSGTGTFAFDFAGTGQSGQDYTLATFASTTFAVADFSATNLAPGVTGHFTLSGTALHFVTDAAAPSITSASTASGTYGSPFSFNITASNSPTSLSVTGVLPGGLTFTPGTGAITGTPTTVGTFNVTTSAGNAGGTGSASLAITIAPASVRPVVTISNRTYDGSSAASIATRSLTDVIGTDAVTLTGGSATFADANVGVGKPVAVTGLALSGAAAGNYTLASTSATGSATIAAAIATPTITVSDKVYDGATTATIVTRSLSGVIVGDAVTLTGGSATFANASAGPAKTVTITGLTLGGAAANYALAAGPVTATAAITPAPVAPTVTITSRTYNGTTGASLATRSLTGVIGADVVALTGGAALFSDASVGAAKTVAITGLTLGGAESGNYSLTATTATATASITPASVTPVFAVASKAYDGTANATIVASSLSGVFGSDDVRLSGATAAFGDTAVGTGKTVTITGFTLVGSGVANYVLATTTVTKTADINEPPHTVTVALGRLNQVYDGTPKAVSVATDPAGVSVAVIYNGSNLPPTDPGRYTVIATASSPEYEGGAIATLVIAPAVGPMSSKVSATVDGPATFSAPATGGGAMTYQWQKNGVDLPGETGPTLTLLRTQPTDVGFYSLVVTSNGVSTRSAAIPLELSFAGKIAGSGVEVGSDIQHPNGNIYDQVLLTGAAVSVKADPGQVLRVSYVDLTDDIVQVEFSGAGVLTLTLDNPSGPAPAANYDQPGVNYMKGHASVVITGADATTNLAVFSVGRATAVNQALFRAGVTYDGWADLAFVGLASATGQFGGIRAGNVSFFQAKGLTGVYAAGIQVGGPMIIGDISASDTARPALVFGAAADARVAGGDLYQANSSPVEVGGLTRLLFVAGTTSAGTSLPAQPNRARFVRDGVDVTNELVP